MRRGKLQTEGDVIPQLPGINISGELSRLKAGQKIVFELEVVTNMGKANSSIDFVFFNKDLNFSGIFKTVAFAMLKEDGTSDLLEFLNSGNFIQETSTEFYKWVEDGNLPVDVEFKLLEKYEEFLNAFPSLIETPTVRTFTIWIGTFASRRNWRHFKNYRAEKGWSVLRPINTINC